MGKAGSQLAQLKSALSTAGLSRSSQPGSNKKKKRSVGSVHATKADKIKDAAKLAAIQGRLNPFDTKVTRLKHEVGGQKVKGVRGKPSTSKQAGIEQRRKTLLVEYDRRSRAGGIVDRRFGENDPNMAPEERMLERFTLERQRSSKVSFNLDDDEDLTHYGQSLSVMDDFEQTGLALDDDDERGIGQIDNATVGQSHFGGFAEEDQLEEHLERKKSKSEVMAEVIAKSKEHKYERQVQKEQDNNARHQLDQEFRDIQQLLFRTPPDPSATGSNSTPLGRPKQRLVAEAEKNKEKDKNKPIVGDEDYDQFVRELIFEKRAKPTDRLKTEEEIALEEKQKLEKDERARLKRMNGEEGTDTEEEGFSKRKRKRIAQADDLDDGSVEDEESDAFGLGAGLDAHHHTESEEALIHGGSEDDGPVGTESGSVDDEDESECSDNDLEEELTDDDDQNGDVVEDVGFEELVKVQKTPSASGKGKILPKELPFTFECPETHEDFLDILAGVDDSDVPTVIHRIRTIYHPSLAEGNKAKLAVFTAILIDYVVYVSGLPSPSFSIITSISPHIFSLCKSYPVESAQAFISKLALMQKNVARGLSQGATLKGTRTFPGSAELTLLRIIGTIWSTSDMSHPVVTPAMLLMGQYLAQCRVRDSQDLVSGLFLCTLFLQYQSLSKRIIPEALNFLFNTCLLLSSHSFKPETLPGSFPAHGIFEEISVSMRLRRSASTLTPKPPRLSGLITGSTCTDQDKVDLLGLTFGLINRFAQLCKSSEGFIEMFTPGLEILESIQSKSFSPGLQKCMGDLKDSLARMIKFATTGRQPLFLQSHKPIAIATYIPKFDLGYSDRKHRDPDHERKADAKLKALYKKEKKSAVKELRKDNRFLAVEQTRRQEEKDQNYQARMTRVVGDIQSERHEQKLMERAKIRDKKRAGRK